MATTNIWQQFKALIPEGMRVIATITANNGNGTSQAELRDGSVITVKGESVNVEVGAVALASLWRIRRCKKLGSTDAIKGVTLIPEPYVCAVTLNNEDPLPAVDIHLDLLRTVLVRFHQCDIRSPP